MWKKERKGNRKRRRLRSWLGAFLNISYAPKALTLVLTCDENRREQNFYYFTIVWLTDTFK